MTCGVGYNRTFFLDYLKRAIRDRYRLPSMKEIRKREDWP
jgi:hypothetical protein